jgi:hypothetical protein
MCLCLSRPSTIEGAGDSAETTPPTTSNPFGVVGKLTASFRPPPPLLHPLDTYLCQKELSRLAKEAHRGTHMVSERRRDGCCSCAVVIRPSLSLLDTGLVRLIVYPLSELHQTPWSAAIPFFGRRSFAGAGGYGWQDLLDRTEETGHYV